MKCHHTLSALISLGVLALSASTLAQPAKRAAVGSRATADEKELPGTAPDPKTTMETIAEQVDVPYRPKPGGHRIKFNLEDADLAELVNHISGLTGKRFIYGAKVRQIKVTVVSPTAVTLDEAYEAFLSILDANGMTVVPHGPFLKIVDSGGIVAKTTPVYGAASPVPNTDRILTRLYRLQHTSPNEISKVLTKFKSKEGDVSVYEAGQLLIITDSGANVRRMIRLIEELDLGGVSAKMWVEPVHYTDASDLAKQLTDIYELSRNKEGSDGGLERIIADTQTNSLIIVGTEESYLRLLELLKRIDVAPLSEGRIHVLALQHADADELSKTLQKMLGTKTSNSKKATGAPVAEMFEGEVTVTGDKSTNSLIVSSSARDYAQLRLVIEQLDQPRRQVFLEAVIMDVSVSRSNQLGLAYHGGATADLGGPEESILLGGFSPGTTVLGPNQEQLQALALGVSGPRLDTARTFPGLNGLSVPAFGVFLNALASSGDSNVLLTPHIIATDNTEAEINVGENVPLQTNIGGGLPNIGALQGAGGTNAAAGLAGLSGFGFGGFNAQRTDVGTKIKITPHINKGDQIRLEIQEEISETGAASGALGAVSITQRRANTTVVVDDQQTVVIGGLMRDVKEKSRDKIPVLGDLPVLGFLFRNSNDKVRKTNLLLILTPHVIRDQGDLRRVFERKMQERQEFLDRYFVFNAEWEPPRDYTRTNGLVEEVRQTFFRLDEEQRIRQESMPAEAKLHEAGEPLELAGSVKDGAAPAAPKAAPNAAPRKAAPAKARPASSNEPVLNVKPLARRLEAAQGQESVN